MVFAAAQNVAGIDAVASIIMNVLIFGAFGLKTPFTPQNCLFGGDLTPLMKININEIQKGTNGCENTWFEPLSVKIAAKLTCIPTEETDRAAK